jgi:ABC-type uncharacterized transport system permease subunit
MTKNLVKNIKLFREFIRLHAAVLNEYRINFYSDIFLRVIEFTIFFLLWKSILGGNAFIPGWDLPTLLILYSFHNLFIALLVTFAFSAMSIWRSIYDGRIDKYLCRPVNVWFMTLGERMTLSIGGYLSGIGGLIMTSLFFGINFLHPAFVFGIILVIIACVIATLFTLMGSALAFWLGKVEYLTHLMEGLFEFDSFPQTIFPWQIQTFLAFTFPFIFASTLPALGIAGKITLEEMGLWILVGIGIIAINFTLFSILWKKGVKRYESHGG